MAAGWSARTWPAAALTFRFTLPIAEKRRRRTGGRDAVPPAAPPQAADRLPSQISPSARARIAASVRFVAPIAASACATCVFTVAGERSRSRAISLLE